MIDELSLRIKGSKNISKKDNILLSARSIFFIGIDLLVFFSKRDNIKQHIGINNIEMTK